MARVFDIEVECDADHIEDLEELLEDAWHEHGPDDERLILKGWRKTDAQPWKAIADGLDF